MAAGLGTLGDGEGEMVVVETALAPGVGVEVALGAGDGVARWSGHRIQTSVAVWPARA